MSNELYFTVGFLTGLGIGVAGILIVKNRERIRREEEVESVKEAYREHFNVRKETEEDLEKKASSKSLTQIKMVGEEKMKAVKDANNRIDYHGYASLVRDIPEDTVKGNQYEIKPPEDDEEPPFDTEDEVEHPSEGYPEPPYVITPEEFAAEPEYSKEDLYYYIVSDTLVDDNETEVDDVDRLIGYDNLRHMGEIEPGCLWVRNPNTMTDYQITGIHGSWEGPD